MFFLGYIPRNVDLMTNIMCYSKHFGWRYENVQILRGYVFFWYYVINIAKLLFDSLWRRKLGRLVDKVIKPVHTIREKTHLLRRAQENSMNWLHEK